MVFQDPILAGATLVRDGIQSEGYVAGSAGWRINRDGSAEFNSGTFRGPVKAVGADGSAVQLATGGAAQLLSTPPTVPGVSWTNAEVSTTEDGTAEHIPQLRITSPSNLANQRQSTIRMYGSGVTRTAVAIDVTSDTTTFTTAAANTGILVVHGANGRVSVLTNNVEEPWQPIVFANGWANQGNGAAGQPAPFRAVLAAAPRRHVAISGVLNGPANGTLSVGNVPAAYAPKYRQPVMCYASPASGVPMLIIEPSGAITPVGIGAAASVWVSGVYPLD